jgi:hypothetical protein
MKKNVSHVQKLLIRRPLRGTKQSPPLGGCNSRCVEGKPIYKYPFVGREISAAHTIPLPFLSFSSHTQPTFVQQTHISFEPSLPSLNSNMYSCTKLVALCLTCAAVSTLAVPNAITLQPLSSGSTGGHEVSDATGVVEGRRNDIEILTSHSKNPSKSHSYHSSYEFNARDGWESVPVTDLSYKYGNITNTRSVAGVQRRQQSGIKRGIKVNVNTDAVGGTVSHAVGETWNSIKGLGKAQGVTITWYIVLLIRS